MQKLEAEDEKSRAVRPVLLCSARSCGQRGGQLKSQRRQSPKEGIDKVTKLQAAATWAQYKPWGWGQASAPNLPPAPPYSSAGTCPCSSQQRTPGHSSPSSWCPPEVRHYNESTLVPKRKKMGLLRSCIRLGLRSLPRHYFLPLIVNTFIIKGS